MLSRSSDDGLLREQVRFLLAGAVNTLIGLLSIYWAKWALGLGDVAANVFGYAIGLTVSFVLNKELTFRYRGALLPAAVRFVLIVALAYAANLAVVLAAIHVLDTGSYVAHAIGVVPYTVLCYLGAKHVAFRKAAG